MLKKLLVSLTVLFGSPAFGQSVQQSGTVTPGHAAYWVTSGVQADGGSAADSPITSFGVTNNGGNGICVSSARQTAVGRNQLCLGASTTGPAVISLQNYGTAAAQSLQFSINGTPVTIPTGGGNFIFGNAPFTTGHIPSFFNTNGVLIDSGVAASNGVITSGTWNGSAIAILYGGTGATTQAGAQTNLGIGTLGLQNANAVAITGGTITGLPAPVNPTDAVNKAALTAVVNGLIIMPPTALATAAVLPNSPTYNNGSSGVGATLTAGTNSTLTVDGSVATLNQVILVNNQASSFQNGIYTVTTAGSGSAAWVLTRATYFNSSSNMTAGSYTFVTGGIANINTSWVNQTTVATVGTSAVTFNLFSSTANGSGVALPQGRLSPVSGVAVPATSNAGVTTVYYVGYSGNNIPIYNGSSIIVAPICSAGTVGTCQLSLALGSAWTANSNWDLFVTLNAGSPVLCSNTVAWTTRTTQLTAFNGFNTNTATMNCQINNSNTISVAANQGTYVGSMRTGSAGQTNVIFGGSSAGGTAANIGLWNASNRVNLKTEVNDTNTNWAYTSATIRLADNSANNSASFLSGLAEDGFSCQYSNTLALIAAGANFAIGCALDSTTAYDRRSNPLTASASTTLTIASAKKDYNPVAGWHTLNALENSDGTNANQGTGGNQDALIFEFDW